MKTMQLIGRALLALNAVLLLAPGDLWAQAVSNPNQITGTISFSNRNPDILAILNNSADDPPGQDQGFFWWGLLATSTGISPTLHNSAGAGMISPRISTPYSVTVESRPQPGVRYVVTPHSMLLGWRPDDFQGYQYAFASAESPPVLPEPAPDAVLNFSECVGLLDVHWIDEFGDPAPVSGGSIRVLQETEAGSGVFVTAQVVKHSIVPGRTQDYLAVRGDGTRYRIDIISERGTNPFLDKVRSQFQAIEVVECDTIVQVNCVLPSIGELGAIVGRVDMLGEYEHQTGPSPGGFTSMSADQGPFDNFRFEAVEFSPSEGVFHIKNLMPSDAVSPPRGYRLFGEMSFRSGRGYEYFMTPWLGFQHAPVILEIPGENSNPRAFVFGSETTDLGDTFVMQRGLVRGNILLAGPPVGPNGSCLEDLLFDADFDADQNGVPNDPRITHLSGVAASGTQFLPPGATLLSAGAFAKAGFIGSFNPATANFDGDYELVLGSLKQEPSIWRYNPLNLFFSDTATPGVPGTYQNSQVLIENANPGHVTSIPGETINVDFNYCFSQVNVSFKSLAGQFLNPSLAAYGTFDGIDFQNTAARYSASAGVASGTPTSTPSDRGMVVLCLPQGIYGVRAFAQFVTPGGFSSTELPSFSLQVGCRQIINPTLDLQLSLNTLPECTSSPSMPVSGVVNSRGRVDRIFYRVNDGPEIDYDFIPSPDPSFDLTVTTLQSCENEIRVTAVDEFGDEASATGFVRYYAEPAFTGCDDILIKVGPAETGATVNFAVTAADNCDSSVLVNYDPPSGAFFPLGDTTVTCTARGKCGNVAECSFVVTVTSNEPPVAKCKNVTVYAGATCSADASIDDGSSDPDAGDELTLSQSPAGPYPVGQWEVTLTVTDRHGLSSQCIATVTVSDTTAPVPVLATLPTISGQCSATIEAAPTANDNCTGRQSLTFSDRDFLNSDWNLYSFTEPALANASKAQVTEGSGNSLQRITHFLGGSPSSATLSVQLNIHAVYAASTHGALDSIDYSEDVRTFSTEFNTYGGAAAPALMQNGMIYVASPFFEPTRDDYTSPILPSPWKAIRLFQLRQADFRLVTGPTGFDGSQNPDFSASASPIAFGFARWNTHTSSSGVTRQSDTDNWSVVAHSLSPAPGVITGTTTDPLSYTEQGTYTVTWTYDDGNGNTSTQTQTVIVDDTMAPVPAIASLPTISGQCSATIGQAPTANDNCAGVITGTTSDPLSYTAQGTYTVTWHYDDGNGNESTQTQTVTVQGAAAPIITSVIGPNGPVALGSSAGITVNFIDSGLIHEAIFAWDDGTPNTIVPHTTGASLSSNHTYLVPGIYSVTVTLVDDCGQSTASIYQFVVIYDPEGGFVTGGGWIQSPPGAYTANSSLTGKANFGFVSKYQQGANVPTGQTEFQFKAGDLNFHSSSYEWLVVAGSKAKSKGSGKINGSGDYGFMLTATDSPSGDKFRIKIWNKSGGGVVYDNQQGDSDSADATTALGGGSIVVHKP